jgi:hypothetical protein
MTQCGRKKPDLKGLVTPVGISQVDGEKSEQLIYVKHARADERVMW